MSCAGEGTNTGGGGLRARAIDQACLVRLAQPQARHTRDNLYLDRSQGERQTPALYGAGRRGTVRTDV